MSFWGELKRRNVYKVGVAYAIVAWLLIQFAAIAFPHLDFPTWAVPFVIIILIIGFLMALLLAWAYEVTPEGIKRTKEVPLSESITQLTGKKLNYILAGVIVLGVAYIVFDKVYVDRRATESEMVSTESNQVPAASDVEKAKKTIAVLPFTDLSPEKDQEYFVDGLSEEVINSLAQISDLKVIGRTSSFTFKGSNKKIQEIASELGVENILEGSVRKAGNKLRITAQLLQAVDGSHLWSKTYDHELKDIFVVQEDIATAVANELKTTLGIEKSLKQLGGTDNLQAYELYLVAKGQFGGQGTMSDLLLALESINAAIALDPEFALAWVMKANIHNGLSIDSPTNRVTLELDAGLSAAQKAVELQPNLSVGYTSMGLNKSFRGNFIEAELAFRKALQITDALPGDDILRYYNTVGYFKRAYELVEKAMINDPLNTGLRSSYIECLGLLGDMKRMEEEFERGRALFGGYWYIGNIIVTYLRLNPGHVVPLDKVLDSDLVDDTAKKHLDSPKDGLYELHQIYSGYDNLTDNNFVDISMWAAYFGDPEFAMDALEKAVRLDPSRTDVSVIGMIWYPVMREVRQLPRFKIFVKKIGLVDYWNKFGWPDICRPLDNGDFECD